MQTKKEHGQDTFVEVCSSGQLSLLEASRLTSTTGVTMLQCYNVTMLQCYNSTTTTGAVGHLLLLTNVYSHFPFLHWYLVSKSDFFICTDIHAWGESSSAAFGHLFLLTNAISRLFSLSILHANSKIDLMKGILSSATQPYNVSCYW